MKQSLTCLTGWMLALAAFCSITRSDAQVSLRILHNFGGAGDGAQAFDALSQGNDGMLYGTTGNRGGYGYGNVFRMNTDGTDYSVIYDFGSSESFGQRSQAAVIQGSDGALYGTTAAFSPPPRVFKVNTNGTGYTVLHTFSYNTGDGAAPGRLLQGNDGALYGTTMGGGSNNLGIVFRLNTNGGSYSVLYNFGTNSAGGGGPYPGLNQGMDGALYGTAGGGSNSSGILFKLETNGYRYAVLHHFGGFAADGTYPYAAPIQGTDGGLYGTTHAGGSNNVGTIYKLNSDGSGYLVLHSFDSMPASDHPSSSTLVQASSGALYGAVETTSGVSYVYRINTDGSAYSLLYSLAAGNVGTARLSLTGARGGGLYGTTEYGGPNGNGTIFLLNVIEPKFTSAAFSPDHSFQLSLSGASNFTYRIEASSDHVNWSPLTNIFNATGTIQVTDPDAANFPRRFYRATTGSGN